MPQYRDILGVDLTEGMVRIVHARRRLGQVVVRTRLAEPMPRDRDQAAALLRELTETHGLRRFPALIALGGESVVFRSIPIHDTDPRSIQQVATMEAEHFDDLSGHETVHDHQLLDTPIHGRQILLAVTRTEAAMNALDIPAEAGLNVLDVIPEPVAWFNAVAEALPENGAPSLLLRVSGEETELLVGNRRHLLFLRRLPIGSHALTGAVEHSPAPPRLTVHQEWADEIKTCLELYQAQLPGAARQPTHAYLIGPPADELNLVEQLAGLLPFPVSRMRGALESPWIAPEAAPYATATGLALEGVGKVPVRLSLLPHDLKQDMSLRLQLKFWVLCGLVVVLTSATIALAELNRRSLLQSKLDAHQLQLNSLQQSASLLSEYRIANQRLTRKIASLRAPIHNAQVLQDLLHAVAEAKHPDDWITRMADTQSYIGEPAPAAPLAAGQPLATPIGKIIVEGYTPWADFSTVQAMIASLREHPAVVEADLLGDDELRIDEEQAHEWARLGCRLFAIEITLSKP